VGREASPTGGVIDSQSVKAPEAKTRGYDAGKKGRAIGVVTAKGEKIIASAVVSNLHPKLTLRETARPGPSAG
jgi:hypothetical protein